MRNIYESIGLKRVINSAGRMTALGVSTILEETGASMLEAAGSYVEIEKLYEAAGKELAGMIQAPDVCIVNSASAGIAMCTASLICKDDLYMTENLFRDLAQIDKREIVLIRGQNINFGAPISTLIEMAGGKIVEAGYANKCTALQVSASVSEYTAGIYFVQSHHAVQKNMVSLEEVIAIGKEKGVPVIVDAAAESDLSKYIAKGADMVIYSGAKAVCGPTSGFVACARSEYASNMRLQFKGMARTMKVGKESIMGLLKAVELYLDNRVVSVIDKDNLEAAAKRLNQLEGIQASLSKDEGRPIYRLRLTVNEQLFGLSAKQLAKALQDYDPAIYTRDHYANIGMLELDPRGLTAVSELDEICHAIEKIGEKS